MRGAARDPSTRGGSNTLVRHWSWAMARRLVVGGGPRHVHLEVDRLAVPAPSRNASRTRAASAGSWFTVISAVGPASPTHAAVAGDTAAPSRRGGAGRQRPQPGPVDLDEPVVGHLLAGEQRPDDVDALAEPGRARRLVRPAVAGDVLVRRLAGAERHPEAAGEHLRQRGDRLGDDRRVVALTRCVDHAERQRRRWPSRRPATTTRIPTRPGARSTARSGPTTSRRRTRPPRPARAAVSRRLGGPARGTRASRRSSS